MIKDKLVALTSFIPIIISLLILIGITLLKGLMDFDFSDLTKAKYWAEMLMTTFAGTLVFSYCYFAFIASERKKKGTSYDIVAVEHYRYQKIVREQHLREELIPAVKKENERRRNDAMEEVFFKYGFNSEHVDYLKTLNQKELASKLKKLASVRKLNPFQTMRFKKEMQRALNGCVKFNRITIDELLSDKEAEKEIKEDNEMSENPNYHSIVIIKKTVKTSLFSMIITGLALKSIFDKGWLEILIKNASVIFSNMLAASMSAKKYINYRRAILYNRNMFFSNIIDPKYLEKKTVENT